MMPRKIINNLMRTKKELTKVEEISEKFKQAYADWTDIRKKSLEDLKFLSGEMYDETQARAVAAQGGAPMISNNRLHTFVQQVENELRQMNVGIAVHATDESGSEDTAEILEGIIRHIENISNAPSAYIAAAGKCGALVPGFGVVKLKTDYVSDDSFDQEIYIEECKDPFSIIPDFNATTSDFSDAEYVFEFKDIPKEEYIEKYGESEINAKTWDIVGSKQSKTNWMTKSTIRIARYWYKERTYSTLYLLDDGRIVDDYSEETYTQTTYTPIPPEFQTDGQTHTEEQTPIGVKQKRKVETCQVKWIETNGYEVLDEGEWHNGDLPFVFFVGSDMVIDGNREIHGIIRFAKDSQKMYNYISSQIITALAAKNRAPWIASTSAIPDELRKQWETSNISNHAILYYRDRDDLGNPINPPSRGDGSEPAIQAYMAASQKTEADMKASLGIFDSGIGQNPAAGDLSGAGKAIQTLTENGMKTNLHFSNNMVLGIRTLGEKIINLIPIIYDTPRVVRIIGADGTPDLIKINALLTKGKMKGKMHDIANCVGCYGVVVDTGQSYATKKSQQADQMLQFVQAFPQLSPFIMDLIAKDMDWDNSHALAERIMKVQVNQYPWMADQEGMEDWPADAKAAVMKFQQQVQIAQQHLVTVNAEYQKTKAQQDSNLVDNQGKLALEQLKASTQLKLKQMELEQTAMKVRMDAINDDVRMRLDHIQHQKDIVSDHVLQNQKLTATNANKVNE